MIDEIAFYNQLITGDISIVLSFNVNIVASMAKPRKSKLWIFNNFTLSSSASNLEVT